MQSDRLSIKFLKVVYPWFPLWAFISVYFFNISVNKIIVFPALLLTVRILFFKNEINVPLYLKLLILFTVYHLGSSVYFEAIPQNTNFILYVLSDYFVLSCLLIFIIQNTNIDNVTINYFNKYIIFIIFLSLIVSLTQIKNNNFFVSSILEESIYFKRDYRLPSIYSWYNFNSIGITFPILIALALSTLKKQQKIKLSMTLLSLFVVSFLSKARYVMISGFIAFSQLIFLRKENIKSKIKLIIIASSVVIIGISIAKELDYNIQNVVNERIFERGKNYSSALTRLKSLYVFIDVFPKHPLFGVGPTTRYDVKKLLGKSAPMIHIGYLSYLYYYGIFGTIIFLTSIYLLLRDAYKVGLKTEFWGIFYGLITFCFANVTLVYFNLTEPGIILSIIYLKYYMGQIESNNLNVNHLERSI